MTGIDEIIHVTRRAYRDFADTPDAAPETRQAVAQAVRFLIADLESAKAITGAALTTVGT